MPIAFRCTACDRMLSIARRKAGTLINCPKCSKQCLVPATAGVAVESSPIPKLDAMPLFERSDFEALLSPAVKSEKSKPAPKADPTPPVVEEDSESAELMAVEGVVVSKQRMILGGIVVAVLLLASFAIGYWLASATVGK